jgi:broad specificity phosphatase PhoE
MPIIEPEVPTERWHLGPEGRAAASELASAVTGPAYFVASDEPKAIETLQEMAEGLDVHTDRRFGEVRRPHVSSPDFDYHAVARGYLEGVRPEGWETHVEVAERFDAAIAHHAAIAADQNRSLVVGSHGVAPVIWLASRISLSPDPAGFWEKLTLPDIVDVDLQAGTAARRGR